MDNEKTTVKETSGRTGGESSIASRDERRGRARPLNRRPHGLLSLRRRLALAHKDGVQTPFVSAPRPRLTTVAVANIPRDVRLHSPGGQSCPDVLGDEARRAVHDRSRSEIVCRIVIDAHIADLITILPPTPGTHATPTPSPEHSLPAIGCTECVRHARARVLTMLCNF